MITYPIIHCAGKPLELNAPRVMAILNITPDSFSNDGIYLNRDQALYRAQEIVNEGAAIIDIGGESTRPRSVPVSIQEELDRIIPIIEAIRAEFPILLSVDTFKPEVMKTAIAMGVNMVNDIRALQIDNAMDVVAKSDVAVCLMHMKGEPKTMQEAPFYEDVVQELKQFFYARIAACIKAGIAKDRIIIDPGFGFGKRVIDNLTLVNRLAAFKELGLPIMLGASRKSSIGKILNAQVDQRLSGSLALAVLAVRNGAAIIRAHDVKATVDALTVVHAVLNEQYQ